MNPQMLGISTEEFKRGMRSIACIAYNNSAPNLGPSPERRAAIIELAESIGESPDKLAMQLGYQGIGTELE